jgi:diguanylate cyclase (GGDEF)-like protein
VDTTIESSRAGWSRALERRLPTLLTWLAGAALATTVYWQALGALQREVADSFERRARDLHASLERGLHGDLEVLYAVRDFFGSFDVVRADEFEAYASAALLRHTALRSLHFAALDRVAVPPGAEDLQDAIEFQRGRMGEPSAAARVIYSVAAPDQRTFAGVDLREHVGMGNALERAIATGQPSASAPLTGLAATSGARLIGVALAVPAHGGAVTRPRGVALAAFDVDALVECSMQGLRMSDLSLHVDDVTGTELHLVHATRGLPAPRAALTEVAFERMLEYGGRTWRCVYEPANGYAIAGGWRPWGAAAGVLAVTAVLALYLQGLQDRSRRVERLVDRGTRELKRVNGSLRDEIRDRLRVEKRLRLLIATTSRQGCTHAERIDELLRIAAQELGLDGGWLARLDNDRRVLTHVLDPDGGLQVEQALELERSLCGETLRRGVPFAVGAVSDSAWRDGPEARDERLSAYIGCPLRTHGKAHGTLAFYSRRVLHEPFDQSDLNLVQLVANWIGQELTELAMEQRLEHQASHDGLTGLPNRMLLRDRLAQALAAARRGGDHVGLLYLDLDGFKGVNDRLGHEAGDRVLVGVAQRLRPLLREEDTLARLGGDEFAVLLPRIDSRTSAELVAERILEALLVPFGRGAKSARLGCSIGIAIALEDGADPELLLRRADEAMYAAKASGKNCWRGVQHVA